MTWETIPMKNHGTQVRKTKHFIVRRAYLGKQGDLRHCLHQSLVIGSVGLRVTQHLLCHVLLNICSSQEAWRAQGLGSGTHRISTTTGSVEAAGAGAVNDPIDGVAPPAFHVGGYRALEKGHDAE
jgi:hypothetical protein